MSFTLSPLGTTIGPLRLADRQPNDVGPVTADLSGWDHQVASDPPIVAVAYAVPVARHAVRGDLRVLAPSLPPGGEAISFTLSGGLDGEEYDIVVVAATHLGRMKTWRIACLVSSQA